MRVDIQYVEDRAELKKLSPEQEYCHLCDEPFNNAQEELDHFKEHIYEAIFDCEN